MSYYPNSKMVVKNMAQKIIFLTEMLGQLSDGNWENSTPHDHWQVFASLNKDSVTVAEPNQEPGVNFWTSRKYNFANRDLLEVVGERMLIKVNLAIMLGNKVDFFEIENAIPDSLSMWDYAVGEGDSEYWRKQVATLAAAGITREMFAQAAKAEFYTWTELRRDCKMLSQIVQNRIYTQK